jgi:hypothetical protein
MKLAYCKGELHISKLVFAASLFFVSTCYGQAITINYGNFGGWGIEVIVPVGPLSTFHSTNGSESTVRQISGSFSIYLLDINSELGTVGINLEQTYIDGANIDSFIYPVDFSLTLNDLNETTNLLTYHRQDDYTSVYCSDYPGDPRCTNFDAGNSTPSTAISAGTVESGLDMELDLGFIQVNGSFPIIDYDGYASNANISLSINAPDPDYTTDTYYLDSNPVPLPASLWLFFSGVVFLTGVGRNQRNKIRARDFAQISHRYGHP